MCENIQHVTVKLVLHHLFCSCKLETCTAKMVKAKFLSTMKNMDSSSAFWRLRRVAQVSATPRFPKQNVQSTPDTCELYRHHLNIKATKANIDIETF